jgi:hypothetical protein
MEQRPGQARSQSQPSSGIQGITQVSVMGQLPAEILDQVLRRLRGHAEHESQFEMHEDVLTRGSLCLKVMVEILS